MFKEIKSREIRLNCRNRENVKKRIGNLIEFLNTFLRYKRNFKEFANVFVFSFVNL
jgi:hypothetical protein